MAGILIGPWCLNLLSADLLLVSDDFRKIALIIILRAGLGLKKETLAKVGPFALRMSIIPCIMEGAAITYLATLVFGMGWIEAGMLGFTISAVSPAVVVPAMLEYSGRRVGSDKGIPTIILAGSSGFGS